MIVKDGIYYALGLGAAGLLTAWLTSPQLAALLWLLALFCLYFFRDPERAIPAGPVAVSPADGKVVAVQPESESARRISIFLNIFDVHVNRAPIGGVIRNVQYRRGRFHVASREEASASNEQNVITIQGEGTCVIFKQIAGLLARRIVFYPKVGDRLERGQRVGLIKFGSRVDVLMDASARPNVKVGDHVKGGSTILAYLQPEVMLAGAGSVSASEKAR